jgi:hypothetical protein
MFQWMMTAYSLFWWSASQQKIVFGLHWNIWWLPTVCFGGQRHNKWSYLVFTETYDDCLQSVLVVSVSTQDRVLSSLKYMTTAYSLFWWSTSQQKIVFGLHWNIWWLPTVCFGGQRHNKRSYFVFTETYNDCLQSVLVVRVTTKDRIWSSLKHMMTAYSLFWWSASQQKIVFCLHWNTDCRQSSYVSVKTKYDLLLWRWPPKQTVGSRHMFQWRQNTILCWDADHQNRL